MNKKFRRQYRYAQIWYVQECDTCLTECKNAIDSSFNERMIS